MARTIAAQEIGFDRLAQTLVAEQVRLLTPHFWSEPVDAGRYLQVVGTQWSHVAVTPITKRLFAALRGGRDG